MLKTLKKEVKWRKDKKYLFICDCKRLIDLKLDLKYEEFLRKLSSGIKPNSLDSEEKRILSEFEKMELLNDLEFRQINKNEFNQAMNVLDNELGKNRVRNSKFLYEKFKEFPQFFIGVFLGKELIGIICGFPRENYLLISEIAIDCRFHNRGFGKKLISEFEKVAFKKYDRIHVGALDDSIYFYSSLKYSSFLLIQFEEKAYSQENFKEFDIIKRGSGFLEVKTKKLDLDYLKELRAKYPKAHFQYIFTKHPPKSPKTLNT